MAIGLPYRDDYIGNATTGTYPYSFPIFAAADLKLIVTDASGNESLVSGGQFNATISTPLPGTGNVILASGSWLDSSGFLKSGYTLSIERARAFSQPNEFQNQAAFFPKVHENSFDHAVMLATRAYSLALRAVRLQEGVAQGGYNTQLPFPAANKVLGWNNAGNAIENKPTTAVSFTGDDSNINFLQAGAGAVTRTTRQKLRDLIHVSDFGAVGDDVADDTAKIQAAIDSTSSGIVQLGRGTYKITAALNLGGRRIHLRGEGPDATIIHAPSTGHDGVNPDDDCIIERMTLRGPNSVSLGNIGIDMGATGGSQRVLIQDVIVEQWGGHGINSGGTSSYVTLRHVVSRNNFDEGLLITGDSHYWTIEDFTAHGNAFNGIDMSGIGHRLTDIRLYQNGGTGNSAGDKDGIVIVAIEGATATTRDIHITNLHTYSNNTHGVRIQGLGVCLIRDILFSNLISDTNGVGPGGSNPATRYGDGLIVVTTQAANLIENIRVSGAVFRQNYRYGLAVDSSLAGTIQHCGFANIGAFEQTGWTGAGSARGINIYSALDTQLSGILALGNTVDWSDLGVRTQIANLIVDTTAGFQVWPYHRAPLSIGASAAQTGHLRLPNAQVIGWRNGAGSGDVVALFVDSSNQTTLRGGGGTNSLLLQASGGATIAAGKEDKTLFLGGRLALTQGANFANADATPSVSAASFFATNNSGATSITDFDDGTSGQILIVVAGDSNTTIVDGGNLTMAGNFAMGGGDTIAFLRSGTTWYELFRSNN